MPAKIAASLLSVLTVAGGCSDPSELILDPDHNQIGVFYTEIPLSASMVLLDSFNTTGSSTRPGNLVVGGDISPFFGETEAVAYSRLSFNPGGTPPTEDAIFDSAKFNLNIASVTGANFNQSKTFTVHPLLEPILDTAYYNFDMLQVGTEPIASGSFRLRADTINVVSMDLAETLALDFFNKLKANDPVFNDIFSFREYFPGIAISGNPAEQAAATIVPGGGTGIALYYHYEGDTVSRAYPINTIQSRYFNQIKSDRSGTPTEVISEPNVAYELPGNLLGSKASLGMVIKIDMAPLSDFLDTLQNVTFNQFVLEMGPLENFPETKQPPRNMIMYFAGDQNGFRERSDGRRVSVQAEREIQVEGRDGSGNVVPAVDNPNPLIFNGEKFIYSQQLNSYVNALYRSGLQRTDLILYPNSPSANADEFKQSLKEYIVNKNTIKLKIYYSQVK